jgi:hypothetical protein
VHETDRAVLCVVIKSDAYIAPAETVSTAAESLAHLAVSPVSPTSGSEVRFQEQFLFSTADKAF